MRPGRPLVISDPMLLVRRDNDRLVMIREKKVVAAVPIRELSHVAVHGPVTFTGAALAGLLDEGIDVTLLSSGGKWRGLISSAASKNVYLLLAQVDAWKRPERRVAFARVLIAGKISGQRQIVQRHAINRGSVRCEEAARRLLNLEGQCAAEEDVDSLRGVEGTASAAYFDVFEEMLSAGWRFPGRVRRPPTDPVNALLSFGYTLAVSEMARALTLRGFDTRIGLVHGLRYGRESLALDLVEEFRAAMVDRFVLRSLNRGEFKVEDFETQDDGAVRLTQSARRLFLERWEDMLGEKAAALRNERPLTDEAVLLAGRIGKVEGGDGEGAEVDDGPIADDEEPEAPVTWRRRMERQALRLWRFLMKGDPYVPLTATRKAAVVIGVAEGDGATAEVGGAGGGGKKRGGAGPKKG